MVLCERVIVCESVCVKRVCVRQTEIDREREGGRERGSEAERERAHTLHTPPGAHPFLNPLFAFFFLTFCFLFLFFVHVAVAMEALASGVPGDPRRRGAASSFQKRAGRSGTVSCQRRQPTWSAALQLPATLLDPPQRWRGSSIAFTLPPSRRSTAW